MTQDEALAIVGMVVTAWPEKEPWTADVMLMYAQGIIDLDADLTTRALAQAHKSEKFRPKVAVLREYAATIRRSETKPQSTFAGHEEQIRLPAWVKGWAIARYRERDFRPWPQQRDGYHALQKAHPTAKAYAWDDSNVMPEHDRARFEQEGSMLDDRTVHGLIVAATG